MTVRTRFAPSPTGFLHIGGARTALYSWLYARHHHGVFILRIEDTDLERSTPESVKAILDGMEWLGLNWDEGPFYQTKRFERYHDVAEQLLKSDKAYRCHCSKERLEALRAEQLAKKQKPRYDGHCRDLKHSGKDQPFVIRFRNPHAGEISFNDQVFGLLTFQVNELDDLIIMRSDGSPTYNFSVVVDDFDMKITHVIRGDDHINNTPRQISILKALDAELPVYAHLPMILGPDGKRFSKRHGAESVMQYRDEGFLPHALLNYLVRLGWSHGDQEIFSREEMITLFNIENVHRSPAAYNPEKLLWLNQHYIKTDSVDAVANALAWQFEKLNINTDQGPALASIIAVQAERAKTLKEMAEKSRFFYEAVTEYEQLVAAKNLTAATLPALQQVHQSLQQLTEWTATAIHGVIQQTADNLNVKLGMIAQPIRVAMTGNTISPPIDITLELLGKAEVLNRLDQAIKFISLTRSTTAT
jgi:glutamyl-tRNA synthetase